MLQRQKTRVQKFVKLVRSSLRPNRYYYLTPNQALVRMVSGDLIYVDPQDETVSANLIAHGHWEKNVTKVVRDLVRPGATVVEVGANLGYYTLLMARRVGDAGKIYSFEANPQMANLTRKSVNLNGLANRVELINKAASDQVGSLAFMISRQYAGSGHLQVPQSYIATDQTTLTVETQPLDDLPIERADVIRLDAEGSEPLILRGATRLLAYPDVVVCMEWSPIQMCCRASVPELVEWLSGLGFRFWRVEADGSLQELHHRLLPDVEHCEVVMARQAPRGTAAHPSATKG